MSVTVRAHGLVKTYRDAGRPLEVLRGIDLDVEAGDQVAVVGPSGSGKSTLLHLLGGLDEPDAGVIEIGGRRLDRLGARERARLRNRTIGFVFQFHQLLPDFTALENVLLPARIAGLDPREGWGRARALLREVGVGEREDHFPSELSGGERQRVALCRALVLDPPLLLADEPTGNLDPRTGDQVFGLLMDMAKRHSTTMVLVTHNPEMANQCARLMVLEEGLLKEPSGSRQP